MAETFHIQLSNGQHYPYQIVLSNRAKYIRIKLSQQGDLSVTIPRFTKTKLGHDFIHSKKRWIEKNIVKVKVSKEDKFPAHLDLKLLSENWLVLYSEIENFADDSPKVVDKGNFIIEIQGSHEQINDQKLVAKTLNHWCKKKAKAVFNVMLQQLAELHGFHYHRLSIRAQKTRWGSCSNQKNINLNCKLLFMPEEVTRYVMIHELCHTIEMNHSKRFWALVEECDPDYKNHQKTLKIIGNSILI